MIWLNDVKYVKVWKVEHYKKTIKLQVSTSEKKQDGTYENSSWFLNLVGNAFEQGRQLSKGDTITIKKGKLSNPYNSEKKRTFLNMVAWEIETSYQGNNPQPVNNNQQSFQDQFNGFQAIDGDDDIPF